jgi:hypothetical protein
LCHFTRIQLIQLALIVELYLVNVFLFVHGLG